MADHLTNGSNTAPNGAQEAIASVLEDEVTVGYRPVLPLESMWLAGTGDMPQITLRRDIEFMQEDHDLDSIRKDPRFRKLMKELQSQ